MVFKNRDTSLSRGGREGDVDKFTWEAKPIFEIAKISNGNPVPRSPSNLEDASLFLAQNPTRGRKKLPDK